MNNILLKCNITAADICIGDYPLSHYVPHISSKFIDKKWQEYQIQANQHGNKIWDGQLYRLQDFAFLSQKLYLELGTIKVREVAVLRTLLNEIDLNCKHNLLNNIFVASIIKTKDDQYLFGFKSVIDAINYKTDLIGGVLSRSEVCVTTGFDILKALYKEFSEEINLSYNNIVYSTLRGIIRTSLLNIGMIWFSQLNIDSYELESFFLYKNDGEISQLLFISENDICKFLNSQNKSSYLSLLLELFNGEF